MSLGTYTEGLVITSDVSIQSGSRSQRAQVLLLSAERRASLSELASESTVRGLMRQDSVHTVPDHLRPQEELLACEDTGHTDEIEADQAAKSSECTEEAGSAQDVKPSREFPTAQVLQAAAPPTTSQPEKRQADRK